METVNVVNPLGVKRFAFIEALSNEFVAMTGYGVYVYLDPIDVERLFMNYQKLWDLVREVQGRGIRSQGFQKPWDLG